MRYPENAIAVIGMAGRFPGAGSIDEFADVLFSGRETIRHFSREELAATGLSAQILARPEYVPAAGVLDGYDRFDAAFFGFSARDAELLDPQQRHFLECAWLALEDAGMCAGGTSELIGVFAGADTNTYLLTNVLGSIETMQSAEGLAAIIANDKDYLASRVSYKLGLHGPSIGVQTACSSSLVAVSLACQSLLDQQCDVAIAGGATLRSPHMMGYLHDPGGILSRDGHCRSFDRDATGTVSSSGIGVVALQRLEDALAQGAAVRAVIVGWGVNNDGANKVSFAAPAIGGQIDSIRLAQGLANVEPNAISFVEAHGTGTIVGDAIELQALTEVFGGQQRRAPLWLASVKTNIGHVGAAAGVAGLIKATLSLERGIIAAHLHFRAPHPDAPFSMETFRIPVANESWPRVGQPRYAGVSSFGIGGTNAHVVLMDAPLRESCVAPTRSHVFLLSAKTKTALHTASEHLLQCMQEPGDLDLGSAAATLCTGRRHFDVRAAAVGSTAPELCTQLAHMDATFVSPGGVTFLLPGQGAQYFCMFRDLYRQLPYFAKQIDILCLEIKKVAGWDPREIMGWRDCAPCPSIDDTRYTQPILFAVEYALAQSLIHFGVMPDALLGHSVGEIVAATLAGVFELRDALEFIVLRGDSMRRCVPGQMLTLGIDEDALSRIDHPHVSVAAVNGPSQIVVGGPREAIDKLTVYAEERGVPYQVLRTSHAFHTPSMSDASTAVRAHLKTVSLRNPTIPFLSGVSGTWIKPEEATDRHYWADQLLQPVRFGACVATLLHERTRATIEVGPGSVLSRLLELSTGFGRPPNVDRILIDSQTGDAFGRALARLWCLGVSVNWSAWGLTHPHKSRLPGYPFEGRRYWIADTGRQESRASTAVAAAPLRTPEQSDDSHSHPRPQLSTLFAAPVSVEERVLEKIWSELLGVSPIGRDDTFSELGGHSLAAIRLAARIREAFSIRIPLRAIFDNETIARLAQEIDRRTIEEADPAAILSYSQSKAKAYAPDSPNPGGLATVGSKKQGPLCGESSSHHLPRPIGGLSVFFFAGAQEQAADGVYNLVERTGRLADEMGLEALWVPDRHFNSFGGLYPDPAVLAACLASQTRRLQLRAGSVVLPARHPVRVAEQWAMVDNLSKGRVGIALASGFHPVDFVFRPENFAKRFDQTLAGLAMIRSLWAGHAISLPDGNGQLAEVRLFPRPFQKELPLWLTSSGNPATFIAAGQAGTRVLTAPLELNLDQLSDRIRLYYQSYSSTHGSLAGAGVTVMMHSYVGTSDIEARATVAKPFQAFLRTHADLARGLLLASGMRSTLEELSPQDADDLISHAFERFYAGPSLMGSPEKCKSVLEQLQSAGVTEIACLVDIGLDYEQIAASLDRVFGLVHVVSRGQ